MISYKKSKPFVRHLLLLILFAISIIILINTLINSRPVQRFFMNRLSNNIGIDIKTGDIRLNFFRGTGLLINNFSALTRNGEGSIKAAQVNIIFDTWGLFSGKFIITSLHLVKPVITIDSEYQFSKVEKHGLNNNKLIDGSEIKRIMIQEGRIVLKRETGDFTLSGLYVNARKKNPSPATMALESNGDMEYKGETASFDLTGEAIIPFKKNESSSFDIMLRTGEIPIGWLKWSKFIRMKRGDFKTEMNIKGHFADQILLDGRIFFESLEFDYIRKGRVKKYTVPELNWDLASLIRDRRIKINPLKMKTHDLSIELDVLIDLSEMSNPYLDLTAKSEFMSLETFKRYFPLPITKKWLETKLFPILERGDVRMDLLKMKGSFNQFRKLKDPGNQSALGMVFDCRNFKISGEGIQLPFDDVSAMVNLSEGDFHILDLNGRFGNSVMKQAGLNVHGMLSGSPFFEIMMDGAFDLDELISQREMYVITSGTREYLDNFRDSRGRLECKTRIGYKRTWEVPRILDGAFFFKDWQYHEKVLSLPLKFNDIEFHIHEEGENHFSGEGLWGYSPFNASGSFEIGGKNINCDKAEINTVMDMNQAVSAIYKEGKFPFRFKQPLPCKFDMVKTKDSYNIKGVIDINNLVMESGDIFVHTFGAGENIEYNLDIRPDDKLSLNQAFLKLNNSSLVLSGNYNLRKRYIENFNIMTPKLSFEDLGIHIRKMNSAIKGTLKGDVQLFFSGRQEADAYIKGYMEGNGIFFYLRGLPSSIRDCKFNMEFTGKEGIIRQCSMLAGKSPLSVGGRIEGWNSIRSDLTLESDFFDLTDIILKGPSTEGEESPMDSDLMSNIDMIMNVDFKKGIWRKLKYDSLRAELGLEGAVLKIEKAHANLEHGAVNTSGTVITGRKRELNISGDISLKDQPIDKLFDEIGIGDKGLKGTLILDAKYEIKSKGDKNPVEGLSGEIMEFKMKQGLIKNSRVFLKILDILNIPAKFKERPPELREKGFYFENMQGNAVIENGFLKTDNFVMKSPVFNAVGSGEENLLLKEHNFRLLVQPLGNIDYILSHVPIVGRILVGDGETIFSVGYDITGPWNKPSLEIAPIENLKGLFGVLKRAVLTPVNLIQKLEKVTTENKEKEKANPEQ
jgi:hypothetical protein